MSTDDTAIAIIGMACRFPGASTVEEFWSNLCAGRESVHFFTEEELIDAGIPRSQIQNPAYVPAAPILDDADCFDAFFFDYAPREARIIDPQQRLFLQTAWHAFEDAGYAPRTMEAPVGVFAGAGGVVTSYLVGLLRDNPDLLGDTGSLEHLGNDKDFIATRVSYKLNLTGPSITVQTACSTSIVALHLACQSLLSGETDFALAGAATVRIPHHTGYLAREGDILSSDGHCRAFDAGADGTIFGSGVGAVLLRPLDRALAAGDPIYAVIKASALNNDGAGKVSYTASSVEGQAKAMVEAMTLADTTPGSIGYVECHGTGTAVGDPLEIGALHQAVSAMGGRTGAPIAIGSVKTNIGHLEQTAGMAALIKTALAVKHGKIPPSLNYQTPNPKIDFNKLPFAVATDLTDWPETASPRRACVNSLGLGGTNAFVVLEEPPLSSTTPIAQRPGHVAFLSARNEAALKRLAADQRRWLETNADANAGDVCHTLATGRTHHEWRAAAWIPDRDGLAGWLKSVAASGGRKRDRTGPPKLIFLFTGQGAQYAGMAQGLYDSIPVFREHVDQCAQRLSDYLDIDLREVLFGEQAPLLDQTRYTQPALFVLETGLAALWRQWGVAPDAVIGHSVGEFAAAVTAGILSLDDGLALIAERGRLMQSLPDGGGMVTIMTNRASTLSLLDTVNDDRLSIAAINAPENTVVAGAIEGLDRLEALCGERGLKCRRLVVSHAFHSPLMDPILEPLLHIADTVTYRPGNLPFLSNLTGKPLEAPMNGQYWRDHARQPVRFMDGFLSMATDGCRFVEIGPGRTLISLASLCLANQDFRGYQSLDKSRDDWLMLGSSVASLAVEGYDIDWSAFDAGYGHRRLNIPGYPFEKKPYWFGGGSIRQSATSTTAGKTAAATHPLLDDRSDRDEGSFVHLARFDPESQRYLKDHVIYDLLVLPIVAVLEMLAWAGKAHFGRPVDVQSLLYRKAMIAETGAAGQFSLSFDADGNDGLQVSAVDAVDTNHMVATIRISTEGPTGTVFNPTSATSEMTEIDTGQFYERIAAVGLNYGPRFRNIRRLWQIGHQAVSLVQLGEQVPEHGYTLHPSLLDACLHIYPALVPDFGDFSDPAAMTGDCFLPTGVERFQIHQTDVSEVWVKAIRRSGETDDVVLDVAVYDQQGLPVAVMSGLSIRRIARSMLVPDRYLDHLYEPSWAPLPKPLQGDALSTRRWVIVSQSGAIGTALGEAIRSSGTETIVATPGNSAGTDLAYDPAIDDAFIDLLAQAVDRLGGEVTDVAFIGPGDSDMSPRHAVTTADMLLRLAQAVIETTTNGETETKLHVVTQNAVLFDDDLQAPRPNDAALQGVWRSFALEFPMLAGKLIDIDGLETIAPPAALAESLLSQDTENQIALRGIARWGLRLNRLQDLEADRNTTFSPTRSATYLITGGLGSLGLKVAEWLVKDHGIERVVLVGRRGPSDDARKTIESLISLGATVDVVAADVTSQADVKKVVGIADTASHPLKGVLHAAGGLDDGVIPQMERAQFQRILAPKVLGGWHLHHATRDCDLEWFVVFSSILGLMGSAGQVNYSAANTYLDGLVAHRRADGLAGTTVMWGPWADTGLATHSGDRGAQIWRRRGTEYIPADLAFDRLETILSREIDQAAVTITDWSIFLKQFPEIPAFYDPLVPASLRGTSDAAAAAFRETLASADPGEAHDLLKDRVASEAAAVLGMAADELDHETPLDEMGFDSLMAVDLFNRLSRALPWKLPMAKVMTGPAVGHLVSEIWQIAFDTDVPSESQSTPGKRSGSIWIQHRGRRPDAAVKLFCFSYAGGGPAIYKDWQERLPDWIEVGAIHLPGRGNRLEETPLTRVGAMIDGFLPELLQELDRPFALFGHCMGAAVMYETARRLKRDHAAEAVHLFASGAPAPAFYTIPFYFEETEAHLMSLLRLIDFGATQALVQDADLRRLAMPVLRADLEAAAFFADEFQDDTMAVPLTAFGGWQDMYAAPHGVDRWHEFTDGPFDLCLVPGNHYFLETEQPTILNTITRALDDNGERNGRVHLSRANSADMIFADIPSNDPIKEFVAADIAPTAEPVSPHWQGASTANGSAPNVTLFCLPPAWVSGLNSEGWSPRMPKGVCLQELGYPGHDRIQDAPYRTLEALISYADDAIQAIPHESCVLFGHGLGAIIAYELAHRYAARGDNRLRHLIVSAAPAPEAFVFPWVHLQPDDKVIEMLETIGWSRTRRFIDDLGTLRADFEAYASYRFRRRQALDIPLTAFSYRNDLWVSPLVVDRWRSVTTGTFRSSHLKGDHFTLCTVPDVELDIIAETLLPFCTGT